MSSAKSTRSHNNIVTRRKLQRYLMVSSSALSCAKTSDSDGNSVTFAGKLFQIPTKDTRTTRSMRVE